MDDVRVRGTLDWNNFLPSRYDTNVSPTGNGSKSIAGLPLLFETINFGFLISTYTWSHKQNSFLCFAWAYLGPSIESDVIKIGTRNSFLCESNDRIRSALAIQYEGFSLGLLPLLLSDALG